MNYRKEKCNAREELVDAEIELKITAIEQLNELRRELFTTAWRLADAYDFEDEWRLTEKQIKQYNEILMDSNELRKYVRLEAIQDNFKAFPPFWYFFGHTACVIAGDKTLGLEAWEQEEYLKRAKQHFAYYEELNQFSILREDQLAASCALEYVDLLLLEEKPNQEKIGRLLKSAIEKSGEEKDIKELCAIAYLKIGQTADAAKLLMQLVNEEYNTIFNAKLLSRIYTSQFLMKSSPTARYDYNILLRRIGDENAKYLYPMPNHITSDAMIQERYLNEQKWNLQTDYRRTIMELRKKYTVCFNAVIPAPYGYDSYEEYYGHTKVAIDKRYKDIARVLKDAERNYVFQEDLKSTGFRLKYVELLNEAMETCDELDLWRKSKNHDIYTSLVRAVLIGKRNVMNQIQEHINSGTFSMDDYEKIKLNLSFSSIMGKLLDDMRDTVVNEINQMSSMAEIEKGDYNLIEFCQKHNISLNSTYDNNINLKKNVFKYLDYEDIFREDVINEKQMKERTNKRKNLIKEAASKLILKPELKVAEILLPETDDFNMYFENSKLPAFGLKKKILAIIDDHTKKDVDLLIGEKFVYMVNKNRISDPYSYTDITYSSTSKYGDVLDMGDMEYRNDTVNIRALYSLIKELGKLTD